MTKEQRQELLVGICGYLPYELKCQCQVETYTDEGKMVSHVDVDVKLDEMLHHRLRLLDFKPYLRPMSSMTEVEKKDFIVATDGELRYSEVFNDVRPMVCYEDCFVTQQSWLKANEWLNARHFDYRGWIEKGWALPAPEEMYQ